MATTDVRHRWLWLALAVGCVALAAALASRAHVNPWLFGVLLLGAWGSLAYAATFLPVARPLRLLLIVTVLALVVVAWNYFAPQPRIGLDAVRLRSLPSTLQPGVIELIVRNGGDLPAEIDALPVAHLAPRFRDARALAAGAMEAEMSGRLEQADPMPPTGTIEVPPGQTARLEVEVPASERAWFVGRGQATVIVTARIHYRDRVFRREKVFCRFANPPSGQWLPCPFLND